MVQVWRDRIKQKKKLQRTSIGIIAIFAGTAAFAVSRQKRKGERKE